MGFSVETDTIVFTILAALAFVMSMTLFRTLRTARTLLAVVLWSLVAAAVFQCVSILFGTTVIPFETFADRSVNLVGKWNDLGLLASLLILMLFMRVELSRARTLWRVGTAIGAAVLGVLLALVNFPLAWGLLLAGSIVITLLAVLRNRGSQADEADAPKIPWYAAAGIVASILFLIFGTTANAGLTSIFPVSSIEVRPSWSATTAVTDAARGGSLTRTLVGTGPGTFAEKWLMYKPSEVNQTPFWNLDFNIGFSTLATALMTVGLVGALAWLIPLILLVAAVVRVARLKVLSREERTVASTLAVAALFLITAMALYVPSQNIVLLAFIFSGAAFGFLWRQGRAAGDEESAPTILKGVGVLATAAILLVASLASGFMVAKRFMSQAYVGKGTVELAAGKIDAAIDLSKKATLYDSTADANRLRVDAGSQKLAAIATDTSVPAEEARTRFTSEVQQVVSAAQAAIMAAPEDYRGYLSLAHVYDYLATLKVEGAYDSAKSTYLAAAERNPTSPAIPLAQARLEALQGHAQTMTEHLTRALTLKPDYTDAILFTVQLNVANNDLVSAVRNTIAAVQSAPGVPSIWFQLGLLYYAGGATAEAIPAFEQAIKLVPNYANAKYFLGLSYAAQNRTADAIKQFEDLASSNPENAEVKTILENLRAGKAPLPKTETPPAERAQAPIN